MSYVIVTGGAGFIGSHYYICGIYNKKYERGIYYQSINLNLPFKPCIINDWDKNWPSINDAEVYDEL